MPHRQVIYDAYAPPQPVTVPPGHAIFGARGMPLWEKDVIVFLDRYLR